MSSHAQKILTLFRSYRTEDQNQAKELLQTLGPSQSSLCAALFSDLSDPFSSCLIPRAIATPQFILQLIDWMLKAEEPELDAQLFNIKTIQLSNGLTLYRSLSRLPKTSFSLRYVNAAQAGSWLQSAPKLDLYQIEIPFSKSHFNLLTKWSCKKLLIAEGSLGTIEIDLNGVGSTLSMTMPKPKNRYSRIQYTYSNLETVLEQVLDGKMEKVHKIWLDNGIKDTLSLRRILMTYPKLKEFRCPSLNPIADWSREHPIRKIDWGWCGIVLSEDRTKPLFERIDKVHCKALDDLPWGEFSKLTEVVVDADKSYPEVDGSQYDATSELYVASTIGELNVGAVLTHFPFEKKIVVGALERSPIFDDVDWTMVHPALELHWIETDFGRLLRQEIHFGGEPSLSLLERVTTLKVDEHYIGDIQRFPNLKTLHIYNCQNELEDIQAMFPEFSVTISNRNVEVGLLNIRHEFVLDSELKQRNAVKTLARTSSCGDVWRGWLNTEGEGLWTRYQRYSSTEVTFVSKKELVQCQWFIQHAQTHGFFPDEYREVFIALVFDAIFHHAQTKMNFVEWHWLENVLNELCDDGYGIADIYDIGAENIARLLRRRNDHAFYADFLNTIFKSVGSDQIYDWTQEVDADVQALFVEWYFSEFKDSCTTGEDESFEEFGFEMEYESQGFCMVVWTHARRDLGLKSADVFQYALKNPSSWESVHAWLITQPVSPVYTDDITEGFIDVLRWLLENKGYALQLASNRILDLIYALSTTPERHLLLGKWWKQTGPEIPIVTPQNSRATIFGVIQALFEQGIYVPILAKSLFVEKNVYPWLENALRDLSTEYLQHNFDSQQFRMKKLDPYMLSERSMLSNRILSLFEKGVFVNIPIIWIGYWLKKGLQNENMLSYTKHWIEHHRCRKFSFNYTDGAMWSTKELDDVLSCLPSETEHLELVNFPFEEIPNGIFRFSNLKKLMVYGTTIQSLPDAISTLVELESVSLSYTKLTVLPNSLRSLPNLKKLYVRGLELSESDNTWLWELHIGRLTL